MILQYIGNRKWWRCLKTSTLDLKTDRLLCFSKNDQLREDVAYKVDINFDNLDVLYRVCANWEMSQVLIDMKVPRRSTPQYCTVYGFFRVQYRDYPSKGTFCPTDDALHNHLPKKPSFFDEVGSALSRAFYECERLQNIQILFLLSLRDSSLIVSVVISSESDKRFVQDKEYLLWRPRSSDTPSCVTLLLCIDTPGLYYKIVSLNCERKNRWVKGRFGVSCDIVYQIDNSVKYERIFRRLDRIFLFWRRRREYCPAVIKTFWQYHRYNFAWRPPHSQYLCRRILGTYIQKLLVKAGGHSDITTGAMFDMNVIFMVSTESIRFFWH